MKLISSLLTGDPANVSVVPARLQKKMAPWAVSEYTDYDHITLLSQEMQSRKFSMYIWLAEAKTTVDLSVEWYKPTFILHYNLGSNDSCILECMGHIPLVKSRSGLSYLEAGTYKVEFQQGVSEFLFIEITPDFMEDIIGAGNNVEDLLPNLDCTNESGRRFASANMSYVTLGILRDLLCCEKKGGALVLEMKKYIFELLSEYISGAREEEQDHSLQYIPHKETFIRIKQYIMQHPNVHDHTTGRIAKHFMLSETGLKKNFKAMFNITLSAFVRSQALGKVHHLLLTTNRSIPDIADETGYSGANNLYPAFIKYYGFSPAKLRQRAHNSE